MTYHKRIGALLSVLTLIIIMPLTSLASDKIERVANGEINWTKRTIKITGAAAPNLKSGSVTSARLGAERAAKLIALRNILEVLKGMNINGTKTVGAAMTENNDLSSKVQGIVKNFVEKDIRYFSDGGVEQDIEMSIDGTLQEALVPVKAKKEKIVTMKSEFTGLVIDASSLDLMPAMAPKIFDDSGSLVYDINLVKADSAKKNGIAGYLRDLKSAKNHNRVGKNPVVVKAVKLAANTKTDLIISSKDAGKLNNGGKLASFLSQGKVIIVAK